ncbi:MAG: DUF4041 domain-containing protein [Anaerolineaceae bacterium]
MKVLGFRVSKDDPTIVHPEDLEKRKRTLEKQVEEAEKELSQLETNLSLLRKQVVETEEVLLIQSYGLYEPQYKFKNSDGYKQKLDSERRNQKELIHKKEAVYGNTNWTVNNSKTEGRKMVNDVMKLLLRAFNSECDEAIDKVRYSNFEQSEKRIKQAFELVGKLGRVFDMNISKNYYLSKLDELHIAFEYAQKKEEEKEQLRLLREEERESAILKKEIEAARQKLNKEQLHYEKALTALVQQLETATPELREEIVKRINITNVTIEEIQKAQEEVDYREANQRAGYVYIISNLGSFGSNVFKIGMSRRLSPEDRINELSDSSVPFNFDIHAMLFSDDAPKLEAALHRRFANSKVNMVNPRREFFYATIEEIKEEIHKNYDKIVDFIDVPQAEQFHVSVKMREVLTPN